MSNKANDRVYEQFKENVDEDLLGHLLYAKGNEINNFLCFLEERVPEFNHLLRKWTSTKEGREWYEKELTSLMDNVGEV